MAQFGFGAIRTEFANASLDFEEFVETGAAVRSREVTLRTAWAVTKPALILVRYAQAIQKDRARKFRL